MVKVLVVDDERPISDIIKFNLIKAGFEVVTAYDGQEALDVFDAEQPDLVLLDQMLPEVDGIEVLRRIRFNFNTPVIMVTAKDTEIDKILGLEMGADDYVTKPFSNRELVARVKANLRNNPVTDDLSMPMEEEDIVIGNLILKPRAGIVLLNNKPVEMTRREFELLYYLIKNSGKIIEREILLSKVWGNDFPGDVRTVDVTVHRIRDKIERNPKKPKRIMTRRGVGYCFIIDPSVAPKGPKTTKKPKVTKDLKTNKDIAAEIKDAQATKSDKKA